MLLYVVQVYMVLLEPLVLVDLQDLLDLVEHMDLLELLVHQVLVEQVDLVVGLVLVVHQEALVLVV
jgi:hypothetical protein